MTNPEDDPELAALRARQKSRNRAMALFLWALVALFFAMTIVKMTPQLAKFH